VCILLKNLIYVSGQWPRLDQAPVFFNRSCVWCCSRALNFSDFLLGTSGGQIDPAIPWTREDGKRPIAKWLRVPGNHFLAAAVNVMCVLCNNARRDVAAERMAYVLCYNICKCACYTVEKKAKKLIVDIILSYLATTCIFAFCEIFVLASVAVFLTEDIMTCMPLLSAR